ncbi:hypothetical protein [Roseobacter sp. MED193]|uniref:hypothetical protein n=1 Tax=Roseobacter sp. MED193 TaxID=314262 RepID=UPI000320CB31|nr:hypothetical protein [Roseobacter sp. MED193]
MKVNQGEMAVSFEEAMQQVNAAPSLRKIKNYLDNSNMSADMKAILYDIAGFSIKVGQTVIAVGRRIFEIASGLVVKFPNFTLSTLVAVVIGVVLNGALGGLPVIGALAAFFSKLLVLLGMAKGAIDDIRDNAAKSEMQRVSAQFDALGLGIVKL